MRINKGNIIIVVKIRSFTQPKILSLLYINRLNNFVVPMHIVHSSVSKIVILLSLNRM